jgi:hypothetical protein
MVTVLQDVRFTTIRRACTLAALLSVLVCGFVYAPPSQAATDLSQQSARDLELFSSVVARLEAGAPYYLAMGSELRARGYPTASVMNWRTPLHLSVVATLHTRMARLVFTTLGLMLIVVGIWALAPRGKYATIWGAVCVARAAALPVGWPHLLVFAPEAWCGLLVGVSVAFYARQRWLVAAACGVLAVFVRELAVPYVVVCGLAALTAGRRKEGLVWLLGGIAYVIYFAFLVSSARAAMEPGAFAHAQGWVRLQGLPFVFATARCYGWTFLTSPVLVPLVVGGGLAAAAAPTAPVHLRGGILVYVATFAIVGQPFNAYWGWVTAPLWAFGLAHSVDGLRSLVRMPGGDPVRTDLRVTVGRAVVQRPGGLARTPNATSERG